jgi:biotin carboxyl carrier protein
MSTITIKSEIAGTVWKLEARPGATVEADDILIILESMKMEIPVLAPRKGSIAEFRVSEGEPVTEGQVLALFTI